MKHLKWLALLFVACSEPAVQNYVQESDDGKVIIKGQTIWAIYDHGGDLPMIDVAMYSITNESQKTAYLQGVSLEKITGNKDSLGNIEVTKSKPIDSVFCKKCFFENQKVGAMKLKHMELYFEPFPVEISYHHNYQAIRLKMIYGTDTIISDAELDVEREEPFDMSLDPDIILP